MRAVLSAFAVAALCVLAGCPQPIAQAPCDSDGGDHGGTDGGNMNPGSDGGNTDAGGDGGTDGGSQMDGGTGDGGSQTDGGVSRADAGTFAWAIIPGSALNETVHAIHGSSLNNMYTASDRGVIRHSTGGTFTDVYATAPSNGPELYAIRVTPSGNVFSGGESTLIACTNNNCVQPTDFVKTTTGNLTPAGGTIESICSKGDDTVYAVGNYVSKGRVWQYDFGTGAWVVRVPDTGTSNAAGCFLAENGDLFISGSNGKLARMTPAYLTFVETVNPSMNFDPVYLNTLDVFGAGGRIFAVGTDRRIVEREAGTKTWNLVFNPPNSTSDTRTITGGGAPDELFATGDTTTDRSLTRFDGTKWDFVPDNAGGLPYFVYLYDSWMPDPDTILLAGEKGFDGVVILGTR